MSTHLHRGVDALLGMISAGDIEAFAEPAVLELMVDIREMLPVEFKRIETGLRRVRRWNEIQKDMRRHCYMEPRRPRGDGDAGAAPTLTLEYNLRPTLDALEARLAARGDIFRRGTSLVRVAQSDGGNPSIREVCSAQLYEIVTDTVTLVEPGDELDGPRSKQPSKALLDAFRARGSYPNTPPLLGVTTAPLPQADGGLRAEPGYDASTSYFSAYSGPLVTVAAAPTRDDALAAYARLTDLVTDFPFRNEMGPVAWLSMVLTLLLRPCIAGPVVIFLVRANTPGTGKTLLCEIAARIVYGRAPDVRPYTDDDREQTASVTAILAEGAPVALFDNVDRPFGGAILDAVATSEHVKTRRYGSNTDIVELAARTVFVATGNNLSPRGDLARRVILVELETPEERPEQRSAFRHHDIRAHVENHRAALLADLATIVRAYAVAGRPTQNAAAIGSFGAWARAVRDPLCWLGLPDPVETQSAMREEQDAPLRGLLAAWETMFGLNASKTLTEAIASIRDAEVDARRSGGANTAQADRRECAEEARALLGALKEIGYTSQDGSLVALGKRFRQFENRRCGGRMFVKKSVQGTNAWMVVDAGVTPDKGRKPRGD